RMTATPGTFWDAIVTTNSGTAIPTSAPRVNSGAVNVTVGTNSPASSAVPLRTSSTATTIVAARNASGTAQRGARRAKTNQVSSTGITPHGFSTSPVMGARHSGNRTPASIACAIEVGMRLINLPS